MQSIGYLATSSPYELWSGSSRKRHKQDVICLRSTRKQRRIRLGLTAAQTPCIKVKGLERRSVSTREQRRIKPGRRAAPATHVKVMGQVASAVHHSPLESSIHLSQTTSIVSMIQLMRTSGLLLELFCKGQTA